MDRITEKIKMFLKTAPLSSKISLLLFSVGIAVLFCIHTIRCNESEKPAEAPPLPQVKKPEQVRGIHLTAWIAGSKKARERINALMAETELNTLVIAIKEYEGEVYIPGVPMAEKNKLFVNAIPDIKEYLADLKSRGIYTIARIVVFKDNKLPRKRTDLAVKNPDGSLWTDHRKIAWTDPYNREVWEYNFSIATHAVALGFSEIQFDYIRYPSDGDTKLCRYSYAHHNTSASVANLDSFLETAYKIIKPLGANVSIDIFGLTTSVKHDMGIGQKLNDMTQWVDYVSPMVYPSHYAKGEYGIPDPNKEPYKVVHISISSAKEKLGQDYVKLRPYLQDFSLGYKYGPKEVRAQIEACEEVGVKEWLLWDPRCVYTRSALKSKSGTLDDAAQLPEGMTRKTPKSAGGEKEESKSGQIEAPPLTVPPTASMNAPIEDHPAEKPVSPETEKSSPEKNADEKE